MLIGNESKLSLNIVYAKLSTTCLIPIISSSLHNYVTRFCHSPRFQIKKLRHGDINRHRKQNSGPGFQTQAV